MSERAPKDEGGRDLYEEVDDILKAHPGENAPDNALARAVLEMNRRIKALECMQDPAAFVSRCQSGEIGRAEAMRILGFEAP